MAGQDRFALSERDSWAGHLCEHGYAVVAGVLSREECGLALSEMWGIVESLGAVRRGDPEAWGQGRLWPPMLHGGMIQYLGHTGLQWRLRALAAGAFAAYYKVAPEELATSFDGMCFMHGRRDYRSRGELISFLHCDQSHRRDYEWSVQGLLNLASSGPEEGGLVVIPGSHKEHRAFFEKHPRRDELTGDWYLLSDAEKEPYRARALKVLGEPGDLLLWDSRTFHCNTVPAQKDAIRACVYTCMLPASRVPPHIRARRQRAWDERRTSNHHPGDGFKVFPTLPRFVAARAPTRISSW